MSRVPRLLPLLAVAIGGVLALKAVAGLEGAPAFLKQATAFAETPAPGDKAAKKPALKTAAKPGDAGAAAKPDPAATTSSPTEPSLATGAVSAADAASPAAVSAHPIAPVCAPSAEELAKEAGLSPAELRVLEALKSRRGELDTRAQEMDTQLAVLSAAEAKVDGKLKALTDLKAEIQKLLGEADTKADAENLRLVTVYSSMKPAQAAAIMTQLDDKVRIPVAAKMKERTLAAILAQMKPDDAKKLTEKLANRFAANEVLAQKVADATSDKPAAPVKARGPRKAPAKAAPAKAA